MATNFEMVKEFHKIFNHPVRDKIDWDDTDLISLRKKLIEEEYFSELLPAIDEQNIIEVADAIGDILYVVYGMAACFGINADKVFAEIHRSNLSKLGADGNPIYRDDGKVMKGPNYSPPDIARVLGEGFESSSPCVNCKGKGKIRGMDEMERVCPHCNGCGSVVESMV